VIISDVMRVVATVAHSCPVPQLTCFSFHRQEEIEQDGKGRKTVYPELARLAARTKSV